MKNEYNLRQAARNAIAREIAKRVEPSDEMIAARAALEEAVEKWQALVREKAHEALRGY